MWKSTATSGKMENVKKSLRLMVEHMGPKDSLGIEEYDSDVRILMPMVKTGKRSKKTFFNVIVAMQVSGMTNFSVALGLTA